MLRKEIRKFLLFFFSLFLLGCGNNYDKKKEYYKNHVNDWRKNSTYSSLYNIAKDSMNRWIENNIDNWGSLKIDRYSLDSNFYFNTDSTRFESFILRININDKSHTNSDYIEWFYGEKIKGMWYFWRRNLLIVGREKFNNKELSFAQLSDIAMDNILDVYLERKRGWPWEAPMFNVSEKVFQQDFVDGYIGGNTPTLDHVQKFKVWRHSMMYDTIEKPNSYYMRTNLDTVKVKGWDF